VVEAVTVGEERTVFESAGAKSAAEPTLDRAGSAARATGVATGETGGADGAGVLGISRVTLAGAGGGATTGFGAMGGCTATAGALGAALGAMGAGGAGRTAGCGRTVSEGKRMPQKPGAGSVKRNSTYPTALPSVLDFTTTQTTSFFVFSFVRKRVVREQAGRKYATPRHARKPARSGSVRKKVRAYRSHPRSGRRSQLRELRARQVAGARGAFATGVAGMPGAVGEAAFSGSFTMGVINHSLQLDLYGQARTSGFPVLPLHGGIAREGAI